MPIRHRPDFKKALSTLHRFKKTEDKTHYEIDSNAPGDVGAVTRAARFSDHCGTMTTT